MGIIISLTTGAIITRVKILIQKRIFRCQIERIIFKTQNAEIVFAQLARAPKVNLLTTTQ